MIGEEVRERLIRATRQAWAAPDVVDLGIGQPADAVLPVELFAGALNRMAGSGTGYPLQYGNEWGDGALRLALGDFLEQRYGVPVDPERMLITNGNSQAIDLVCGTLARPGDVVLVEEPSYFLALQIFRDHHLRVVGVPVDEHGLVIEALAEAVREHRPALVYTIPSFQNPTGTTLPPDRRQALVDLAAEHGFLVVADEVYHLLSYPDPGDPVAAQEVPPPMAAFVDSGVVLSLGTFSKILAPGLRLGWIQAATPLLERLAGRGFIVSGGGLNPVPAALTADLLADGSVGRYLDGLREIYAERVAVMDAGIRAHFPPSIAYRRPTGGYFFWLRYPGRVTAAYLGEAARRKVGFRSGTLFSASGGLADHLRLSFAFYDVPAIERAMEALGEVLKGPGGTATGGAG